MTVGKIGIGKVIAVDSLDLIPFLHQFVVGHVPVFHVAVGILVCNLASGRLNTGGGVFLYIVPVDILELSQRAHLIGRILASRLGAVGCKVLRDHLLAGFIRIRCQTDGVQTKGIGKEGRNGIGIFSALGFPQSSRFILHHGVVKLPGGIAVVFGIAHAVISCVSIHPEAAVSCGVGNEFIAILAEFFLKRGLYPGVFFLRDGAVLGFQIGLAVIGKGGIGLIIVAIAVRNHLAAVIVGGAEGAVALGEFAIGCTLEGNMHAAILTGFLLPVEYAEFAHVLFHAGPIAVVHVGIPPANAGRIGVMGAFCGVQRGGALIEARKLHVVCHPLTGNRRSLGGSGKLVGYGIEAVEFIPIGVGAAIEIVAAQSRTAGAGKAVNLRIAAAHQGHTGIAPGDGAAGVISGKTGNAVGIPVLLVGFRHIHRTKGIAFNHAAAGISAHHAAAVNIGLVAGQHHAGGICRGGADGAALVAANQAAHIQVHPIVAGGGQAEPCRSAIADAALVASCQCAHAYGLVAAGYGEGCLRPSVLRTGSLVGDGSRFAAAQQGHIGNLALSPHRAEQTGIVFLGGDICPQDGVTLPIVAMDKGNCLRADDILGSESFAVITLPVINRVIQIHLLEYRILRGKESAVAGIESAERKQLPGGTDSQDGRHFLDILGNALGKIGVKVIGMLRTVIRNVQILVEGILEIVVVIQNVYFQRIEIVGGSRPLCSNLDAVSIAERNIFAIVLDADGGSTSWGKEGQSVAIAVELNPVAVVHIPIVAVDIVHCHVAAPEAIGIVADFKIHQSAILEFGRPVAIVAHTAESGIGICAQVLVHQQVRIAGVLNIGGASCKGRFQPHIEYTITGQIRCGDGGQAFPGQGHRTILGNVKHIGSAGALGGKDIEAQAGIYHIVHCRVAIGGALQAVILGIEYHQTCRLFSCCLEAYGIEVLQIDVGPGTGIAHQAAGSSSLQIAIGIGADDVHSPVGPAHQAAGGIFRRNHRGGGAIENAELAAVYKGAHQAAYVLSLEPGGNLAGILGRTLGQPGILQVALELAEVELDIADGGFANGSAHQAAHIGRGRAGHLGAGENQIFHRAMEGIKQAHVFLIGYNGQALNGGHSNDLALVHRGVAFVAEQIVIEDGGKGCAIAAMVALRVGVIPHKGDVAVLDGFFHHDGIVGFILLLEAHLGGSAVQVLQMATVGNGCRLGGSAVVLKQAVGGGIRRLGGDGRIGNILDAEANPDICTGGNLFLGIVEEAALVGVQAVHHPFVGIAARRSGFQLGKGHHLGIAVALRFPGIVYILHGDGKLHRIHIGGLAAKVGDELFRIGDGHQGDQLVAELHINQVTAVVAHPCTVGKAEILRAQLVQPHLQAVPGKRLQAIKHRINRTGFRVIFNDPLVIPQLGIHAALGQDGLGSRGDDALIHRVDIIQVLCLLIVFVCVHGNTGLGNAGGIGPIQLFKAADAQFRHTVLGRHIDDLCLAVQLPLAQSLLVAEQGHNAHAHEDCNQRNHHQDFHQGKSRPSFLFFMQLYARQFHIRFLQGSIFALLCFERFAANAQIATPVTFFSSFRGSAHTAVGIFAYCLPRSAYLKIATPVTSVTGSQ